MKEKKYKWCKIAESEKELDFGQNNLLVVEANNKKITLAKHNGGYFACAHSCPHAGGILAEGHMDAAGNIVCPVHRYKFSLVNGRNVSGEGYKLKIYPLKISEDGVFAGFEEHGLWEFL